MNIIRAGGSAWVVTLLLIAAVACSSGPNLSDVRSTTEGWLHSLAASSWSDACSYLDPDDASKRAGSNACESTMEQTATLLDPTVAANLKSATVDGWVFLKDRAIVGKEHIVSSSGPVGFPVDIKLRQVSGSWYIDSFS